MPYSHSVLKSISLSALAILVGCGSDDNSAPDNSLPIYETLNTSAINPLNYSDIVSADLDGDGDMDLAQCGYSPVASTAKTEIYINDKGTFNLLNLPLDSTEDGEGDAALNGLEYECALDVGDVDNDGDMDIVGTGAGPAPDYGVFTHLFINQGNHTFTVNSNFLGTNQGFVSFTDINNDKHLEILINSHFEQTGQSTYVHRSVLYLNNADGTFSVIENPVDGSAEFQDNGNGTHAWGDFNGDNYQDLITLSGQSNAITHLYVNNKNNTFTKVDNPVNGTAEFPGLYSGPVSWGDIDGDNDLDILISARHQPNSGKDAETLIFENLGSANDYQFSLIENPIDTNEDNQGDSPFTEHGVSEIFLADIDGINQLDIVLFGENNDGSHYIGNEVTSIYLNTGDKTYEKLTNPVDTNNDGSGDADFLLMEYGGATVADLDNDGDNELIYNGKYDTTIDGRFASPTLTLIYENINGTTFVKVEEEQAPEIN